MHVYPNQTLLQECLKNEFYLLVHALVSHVYTYLYIINYTYIGEMCDNE